MINHVSDTAFWIASYRAQESLRSDALFNDPFASLLAGEKGQEIVDQLSNSQYVSWSVVIRTIVIDQMIIASLSQGVDTIINLGAGLDTRLYRLPLPSTLNWIEVDHPHLIEYKSEKLKNERTTCRLERVSLDLSNIDERQIFFNKVNKDAKKTLILTEGVIPYLSEAEVSSLASDLYAQNSFLFWIAEYYSHEMYKHLRNSKKNKEMLNSPFKFFPNNWFNFFNERSWQEREIFYLIEEGRKLGRSFPIPWWARVLHFITPNQRLEQFQKMSAYVLFQPR